MCRDIQFETSFVSMMTSKYLVSWTGHSEEKTTALVNLLQDRAHTDVTLLCDDDEELVAHKVLLAATSPFFQRVLGRTGGQQHPILYLRGASAKNLGYVLNFIYCGQAAVPVTDLEAFVGLAKDLEIKGLTEKDFAGFKQNLKSSNALPKETIPTSRLSALVRKNRKSPGPNVKLDYLKTEIYEETSIEIPSEEPETELIDNTIGFFGQPNHVSLDETSKGLTEEEDNLGYDLGDPVQVDLLTKELSRNISGLGHLI